MNPQFEELFARLRRAVEGTQGDLTAALAALRGGAQMPPLCLTWFLIVTAKRRRRQEWFKPLLWRYVLNCLPPLDAMVEASQPLEGDLDRMPKWSYSVEAEHEFGSGTNDMTGEMISLDLSDPEAEGYVYVPEFADCLGAIEPGGAEARMLQLLPSPNLLVTAAEALVAAGMLEAVELYPESYAHRLTGAAMEDFELLVGFSDAWDAATGAERILMAEMIGDWPAAYDAAVASGDPELVAMTRGRMESCRAEGRALVRQEQLEKALVDAEDLDDLAETSIGDPHDRLVMALQDPSWSDEAVMRLVERLDDPAYCLEVRRLFDRVRTTGIRHDVELAVRCARFLLRHHHRDAPKVASVIEDLPPCDQASLMTMEHMPGGALPVIRRELRSPEAWVSWNVAAMLALLDKPWCVDELRVALRESASAPATESIRAALRVSADPDARAAASLWELCHTATEPGRPAPGVGGISNPVGTLQQRMVRISHRVLPLRNRTPGEVTPAPAGRNRRPPSAARLRVNTGGTPRAPVGGRASDVVA